MHRPPKWMRILSFGVLFALLIFVLTIPAFFYLSDRLIGNNIDIWIFYWNNWWTNKALTQGENLFFSPYLFSPAGTSLIAHSNSYINTFLASAFLPFVGPVVAYNLVVLLGLWISAMGMVALSLHLNHNNAAALFAGFVFTFAPYHITQILAHGHLGSIHWWPYFALYFHRLVRDKHWFDALVSGVFLALIFWTGMQLALLIALWALCYVLWSLIKSRARSKNQGVDSPYATSNSQELGSLVTRLALTAAITLLLMMPFLVPMLRQWDMSWTSSFDRSGRDQTDLLSYFVPPTYNPFFGEIVNPVYERFVANRAFMPYLGIVVTVLVCLSLWKRPIPAFWLIVSIIWIMLSTGSALRINGKLYPAGWLPYQWFANIFPFSTLRAPDRFNLLLVFSVSVLIGFGVKHIHRKIWLIIGGLILLCEYIPVPLVYWKLPIASPFYSQIAQLKDQYTVVDVPLGYNASKLWLYFQTLHGKPIVEGHVSRHTPDLYSTFTSNNLLSALYQVSSDDLSPLLQPETFQDASASLINLGSAVSNLRNQNIRYILVHEPYITPADRAVLRDVLPFIPVYRDTTLSVYDLHNPLTVLYEDFPHPVAKQGSLINLIISPGNQNNTWHVSILIEAAADNVQNAICHMQLNNDDIIVSSTEINLFPVMSDGLTWRAGDLSYIFHDITLPGELVPGEYQWSFLCESGIPYLSPDYIVVDNEGNSILMREQLDVVYGETIKLLGYRWNTLDAYLNLDLVWSAKKTPGIELITFVHLVDGEGTIYSQYDAIPCDWTCPTQTWQPGELVFDRAILDIANLPSGEYSIAMGFYNPITNQRLDAVSDNQTIHNGYVMLPETLTIHNVVEVEN